MGFDQYKLAKAIHDYIEQERPGVPVAVSQAETDTLPIPCIIIYPLGMQEHDGSMDNDEMAMVRMQITTIGATAAQCAGIQAGLYRMLLSQTGSSYTAALAVEGQKPLWRMCEGQGPVLAGDQGFRADDTYAFKETLL